VLKLNEWAFKLLQQGELARNLGRVRLQGEVDAKLSVMITASLSDSYHALGCASMTIDWVRARSIPGGDCELGWDEP